MIQYKFVELSKGEFEGTVYNNVTLSDGLRACKFKNATNQDDAISKMTEGLSVEPVFEIVIGKVGPVVILKSLTVKK